jgi:hypothetical protein
MKMFAAIALCAPLAAAAPLLPPDAPGHCTVTIHYHPSNPQHINFKMAGDKATCDARSLQIALKHLVSLF